VASKLALTSCERLPISATDIDIFAGCGRELFKRLNGMNGSVPLVPKLRVQLLVRLFSR
jgi:hypothetical protein